MVISVIIPTLNEEVNLPVTLRQLTDHPDVELIVVDGGSTDRTLEIAQRFTPPYVFRTTPGRAQQMNIGARHATGDILLFLHADTFLLPGALDEIQRRIIGDGAVGGAFDLPTSIRGDASANLWREWPVTVRAGCIYRTATRVFLFGARFSRGSVDFRKSPSWKTSRLPGDSAARGGSHSSALGWSPAAGGGMPMA